MTNFFLALDYMVGVADQSYASAAVRQAAAALAEARRRDLPIGFTKVGFLPGHPDVSPRNKVFHVLLGTDKLTGGESRLVDTMAAREGEVLVDKKRFSAFAGSGLWTILRSSGASSITMCGLSTSGVVLSTALDLIDRDFEVTILSDACADPDDEVHRTVLEKILAERARVCRLEEWASDPSSAEVAQ